MFFNILATFAEFESDRQQREPRRMYDIGDYSVSNLAEVFSVSRPTIYRTLQRTRTATYRSRSHYAARAIAYGSYPDKNR